MGKGLFAEFLRAGRFAKPFPDLYFIVGKLEAQIVQEKLPSAQQSWDPK